MDTTPDWYKGSYNPNGHCSLYEKAVEYCCAVIQGRDDEDRVYLHKELAALYGLEPSETRHITDNLPIPMDPYERPSNSGGRGPSISVQLSTNPTYKWHPSNIYHR